MTPAEIATAFGGEVFRFDYDRANVAQAFVFNADDWGLYTTNNTDVTDVVRPSLDDDGITSVAGTFTSSITLFHLDTYSSAHVSWEGTGITVQYTLDGTTWTTLVQHGVIGLSSDPDFDIRVSFAGGVVEDTAQLESLTVYILETDTLYAEKGSRELTFSTDPLIDGTLTVDTAVSVSAADTEDVSAPVPVIGTIEMWVTPTTTTVLTAPANVMYKNGVAGSVTAGVKQHIVVVLNAAANTSFTVGPNLVLHHLAVYAQRMTAGEVATLYASQTGPVITVNDSGNITVTESSPATDIYAYDWSVVQATPA